MSELVRGSSVPLFDRLALADERPGEGAYLLLPEQLEASIGRELSRLFNTRTRLMPSQYGQSTGTVIDYGIPDFSALSPSRGEDLELIQAALKQAISHFEPRLSNVTVVASSIPGKGHMAQVRIGGDVVIGLKPQRVSFELKLDEAAGSSGGS